jgi:hypothetical protein
MKMYHWKNLIAERHRLAQLRKGAPAPGAPDVKVDVPKINKPSQPALRVGDARQEAGNKPGSGAEGTKAGTPETKTLVPNERIVALAATTPGREICLECEHYSQRECTNPRARHPVTGTYVDALAARKDRESCGPKGRYWKARMAVQCAAREASEDEPNEYAPPVPVRRLQVFDDEVVAVLYEPAQVQPRPFLIIR